MHQCDNEDMPQKDTIIHLTVLPCLSDRTRADIRADLLEKMQTAAGTEKDALQAVLSAVDSRNELPGLDARLVHALRLHYLDGQPWGCVAQYLADPGQEGRDTGRDGPAGSVCVSVQAGVPGSDNWLNDKK